MPKAPIEPLKAWIADCVAHLRDREGFRVRSHFSPEAIPLARAALEHAVTLQRTFHISAGIDRFPSTARLRRGGSADPKALSAIADIYDPCWRNRIGGP